MKKKWNIGQWFTKKKPINKSEIKEDEKSSFILFQYFITLKRRYNSFPTETSALKVVKF